METPLEATVRGRDLVTGLPREVIITDVDIREAIAGSIDQLVDASKEVLETAPPEVVSDVMRRGFTLLEVERSFAGSQICLQSTLVYLCT